MTAAENWSSNEGEDALPMDMDSSEDEVSVESNQDDAIAVTKGVNCTLAAGQFSAICEQIDT